MMKLQCPLEVPGNDTDTWCRATAIYKWHIIVFKSAINNITICQHMSMLAFYIFLNSQFKSLNLYLIFQFTTQ